MLLGIQNTIYQNKEVVAKWRMRYRSFTINIFCFMTARFFERSTPLFVYLISTLILTYSVDIIIIFSSAESFSDWQQWQFETLPSPSLTQSSDE